VPLHDLVRLLPPEAGLGQRQQHALREDDAVRALKVGAHAPGIDLEPLDHHSQAVEREIEGDGGVGRDHPLDRGVGDVALVPQRHVLERRDDARAHQAGEAGQVLGQHGIALVRHGG
jgi:hypothetical protein